MNALAILARDLLEPPRWMRPNERLSVAVHDCPDLLSPDGNPTLFVSRFIVDERGDQQAVGTRTVMKKINAASAQRYGKGYLVDLLVSELRELVSLVCPAPRPKGWRLFNRRPRR